MKSSESNSPSSSESNFFFGAAFLAGAFFFPLPGLIPSTAAIDAGLALSGVYGAGIAAAASVANGVALMRRTLTRERESKAARKKAGTTQLARGGGGGGDAGTSDAPPPRASDEPEIAEEVVDDEYARMMAELED